MSCTDVQTIQAGNGTKTQFSFDFPYIFKSEIHVYFWNATTKEWDEKLTTDATYPWQVTDANPTIVEFTSTAPPSPTTPTDPGEPTVDNVRIRRITNLDDIRALFNPGSAIRSDDLNNNFEQLRYAIQESGCQGIPDDVDDYLKTYYWNNFDDTVYSTDTWDSSDSKIASTAAMDARYLDQGTDTISEAEQDAGSPAPSDVNVFSALAAAKRFDTIVQTGTPSGSAWETGKTWLQNDADLTLSIWNGSAWTGIVSGGTFINQPKVVYVDASSGDDVNDGHRISRPKRTIKAAINQINADSIYGDGSVVVVAPGVYQEAAPIDIQKKDVSIIGQAIRSCIVHPTVATQYNSLFRLNSGSYVANLTLTGMKATGTRGEVGSEYEDATYGLPATQGWNFSFYPNAVINKSPYIQNCTNFSDSEIDNSNLNAHTPAGGSAGDTDSAMTGGGLLVDGSVVDSASPLRSMVCDSYTHVGLDGPGILVTNNGYCQATSSYAFFNHFHIACINGGQANLAASTTDFGRYSLVTDGKSPNAIFTATTTVNAADNDITFTIGAPTAGSGWYGSATRPQSNMLVTINSITYPVLSATANGAGWDVTISRPNPSNKSENLGLNGAVSSGAAVSFFLRSMIASSGHTMEYVGSGTNYSALPENGGVPDDTAQVVELNDGKVWTAITDHNGKFTVGPLEVDQRTGALTIEAGASVTNIVNDPSPQLGGDLDTNNFDIILDAGTAAAPTIRFNADADTGIYSPGADQVALTTGGAERLRIDSAGNVGIGTSSPSNLFTVSGSGAVGRFVGSGSDVSLNFQNASSDKGYLQYIADNLALWTNNTERMRIDSSGRLLVGTSIARSNFFNFTDTSDFQVESDNGTASVVRTINDIYSPAFVLAKSRSSGNTIVQAGDSVGMVSFQGNDGTKFVESARIESIIVGTPGALDMPGHLIFSTTEDGASSITERMRIDSSGNVGIGTSSPSGVCHVSTSSSTLYSSANMLATNSTLRASNTDTTAGVALGITFEATGDGAQPAQGAIRLVHTGNGAGALTLGTKRGGTQPVIEALRIDSAGRVGIGTTSPGTALDVNGAAKANYTIASGPLSAFASASGGLYSYFASTAGTINAVTNNSGAAGTLIFATGSERMRISSAGNVGIGTSSPNYRLDASFGSSNLMKAGFDIDAGGNPTLYLNRWLGVSTSYKSAAVSCLVDGTITFSNATAGSTPLASQSYTERMRIDATGCINIGAGSSSTNSTGLLLRGADTSSGTISFQVQNSSSANVIYCRNDTSFHADGVYNATTTSGANVFISGTAKLGRSISSIKFKTDVETLQDSYADAILNCRPVWFRSLASEDNPEWGYWGFIAEEVYAVDPRLTFLKTEEQTYDENGQLTGTVPLDEPEPEGVQYDRFVPHLVNLIKRQRDQIAALEARVAALENP